MDQNEKKDKYALIEYRLLQAGETLEEASLLFANNNCRGAINRAYYSIFYCTLALLITKDLGSSKHSGAISLFDKNFVKPGIIDKKYSKIIHEAFDKRQAFDYAEFVMVDRQDAELAIKEAKDFFEEIKKYLKSY